MGCRTAGGPVTSFKMAAMLAAIVVLPKIRNCKKKLKIGNF